VHLDQIDEPALVDFPARRAFAAGRVGDAGLTVETLREDARDGGLADAARTGEQEGVVYTTLRQRISQRDAHVFLPHQFGEGTRPPFARQREIAHLHDPLMEAARTSRTSAPDIEATAAPFRA